MSGWTKEQKNVVVAAYLGWVLDFFDFTIMVFILRDIAQEFGTDISAVSYALVLTLALRPVGAFLFGRAADHYGRRPVLMASIFTYSLLAFASGFATSLTMLLILRALFGVAMGGEWGVGASLTMESIPPKARGIVSGILQSGTSSGYLLASIVYGLLFQYIGWRGMFMIGILPALVALYIRRHTKESPAWRPRHARTEEMTRTLSVYSRLVLYAIVLWAGMASYEN